MSPGCADIVLDAAAAGEAAHAARAADCLAVWSVADAQAGNCSQDVGEEIGPQALDLFRTKIESVARPLPLGEPNLVETGNALGCNHHGIDDGDELRKLDRNLLRLARGKVHGHCLGAESKVPRQQHMASGRQIAECELSLFVGESDYIGSNHLDPAAGVGGAALENDAARNGRVANLGPGIGSRKQQSTCEQLAVGIPDADRNLRGYRCAASCLQRRSQGARKSTELEQARRIGAVAQQAW
jgi:hypothetical protein